MKLKAATLSSFFCVMPWAGRVGQRAGHGFRRVRFLTVNHTLGEDGGRALRFVWSAPSPCLSLSPTLWPAQERSGKKQDLNEAKTTVKRKKMEQKITILAFAVGSLLQAARHVAI